MTRLLSFLPIRGRFRPVSCSGGAGAIERAGHACQHNQARRAGAQPLLSRLVRRAFAAEADAQGGDYPPSDCWPSEVVTGGVRFHGANFAATETSLSTGKFAALTAGHVATRRIGGAR